MARLSGGGSPVLTRGGLIGWDADSELSPTLRVSSCLVFVLGCHDQPPLRLKGASRKPETPFPRDFYSELIVPGFVNWPLWAAVF